MEKIEKIIISKIDMQTVLKYLGYGNSIPNENIQNILDKCEKNLLSVAKPAYIYRVFDIDDQYNIIGCNFKLLGKDIRKHLNGCDKIAMMCVTLSADVDRLIRISQLKGMVEATIIDAMASAMVEQVCDKVEEVIRKDIASISKDYTMTWRYGLGYGDFPLEEQRSFLNVLDATKKIGVAVNDGMMLMPSKSVTCIVGISKNKIDLSNYHKCNECNLKEDCQFRTRGTDCGH